MPDIASKQVKETVTSLLYQPAALGEVVAAALIVGAVASRLMVTDCEFVPPALVALQMRVRPAVSELMVVDSHPVVEVIVDSGSDTVQLTVTSLTYQPLLPSVPLTLGVITGGVVSVRAKFAVIVPVPFIVAVVDADEELVNVILAVDELHEVKA